MTQLSTLPTFLFLIFSTPNEPSGDAGIIILVCTIVPGEVLAPPGAELRAGDPKRSFLSDFLSEENCPSLDFSIAVTSS
jgi:hypothetical protein